MKIGSLPVVAMEQYQANKVRARKTETAPMGKDSVELSGAARLFEKALSAAKDAPEVRMERVAAVSARVAAGTYQVDASAIAAKMLAGIGK
ncbi:MAG: flagellar biosynthesis anti-sigma factor FlgM [Oscillospiraceae bacterium]|nr:flagellar biosynthesis anti-sigma factor FlgM [Oscillospiraceae bacterium]